jgi:hypothetical protein
MPPTDSEETTTLLTARTRRPKTHPNTSLPKNGLKLTSPNIQMERLTGGRLINNTLQLIRRTNTTLLEPSSVLIRRFGLEGSFEELQGSSVDFVCRATSCRLLGDES